MVWKGFVLDDWIKPNDKKKIILYAPDSLMSTIVEIRSTIPINKKKYIFVKYGYALWSFSVRNANV